MSDFLAYLVERVLDSAAAPRPRARSRFEPIAVDPPALLDQVVEPADDVLRPRRIEPVPPGSAATAFSDSPRAIGPGRPDTGAEPPAPGSRVARRAQEIADPPEADRRDDRARPRPAPGEALDEVVRQLPARAEAVRPRSDAVVAEVRLEPGRSPAAPVIRVSIGRVEVRAVPAPPAVVRARPPAAEPRRASLDEYLSRRARGVKP